MFMSELPAYLFTRPPGINPCLRAAIRCLYVPILYLLRLATQGESGVPARGFPVVLGIVLRGPIAVVQAFVCSFLWGL